MLNGSRALQAEAVTGQGPHPPVRYIVSDAAALCAREDTTDQESSNGDRVAGGSSGSRAAGTQGVTVLPGDAQADGDADRRGATLRPAVQQAADADSSTERLEGDRLLPPGSFDTVVDTFGLCSHADPVAALQVPGSSTSHHCSPIRD